MTTMKDLAVTPLGLVCRHFAWTAQSAGVAGLAYLAYDHPAVQASPFLGRLIWITCVLQTSLALFFAGLFAFGGLLALLTLPFSPRYLVTPQEQWR